MLEELFNVLKNDCKTFNLEYREDKYKLVLDGVKDFTADTVEDVVIDALDWLDSNESNENKTHIEVGNTSHIYKIVGYESDGRE